MVTNYWHSCTETKKKTANYLLNKTVLVINSKKPSILIVDKLDTHLSTV